MYLKIEMFILSEISIIIRMSESKNATANNMSNQDYFTFDPTGQLEKIYKSGDKDPRHNLAEIIDDAIDAQATKTKIVDAKSPTSNIHIVDNGDGMTKDEAQYAINTYKEKPNPNDYIDGNKSGMSNFGLKEAIISLSPDKPTVTRSFPKDKSKPQKINWDFAALRQKGMNHPDRPKFRYDMTEEDIKQANDLRKRVEMEENKGTSHTLLKNNKLTSECKKHFKKGLKMNFIGKREDPENIKLLESYAFRYGMKPGDISYVDEDGVEHTLKKINYHNCENIWKKKIDLQLYRDTTREGKADEFIVAWKEGKNQFWLKQVSVNEGKFTRVYDEEVFDPVIDAVGYTHVCTLIADDILPKNPQYYDPEKTEVLPSCGSIGPYEREFYGDWTDGRGDKVLNVPPAHRDDLSSIKIYRNDFGMSYIKADPDAGGNIGGGGAACHKKYFRYQFRRSVKYYHSRQHNAHREAIDGYVCKPNKTKMKPGRADKHLERTLNHIFRKVEEKLYENIMSDLQKKRDAKAAAEKKRIEKEVLRNRAKNVEAYLAEGVTVEEATDTQVRDAEEKKRAEEEAKKAEEEAKKAEEDDDEDESDEEESEEEESDEDESEEEESDEEKSDEGQNKIGEDVSNELSNEAKKQALNNLWDNNEDFRREVEELMGKYTIQDETKEATV